MDGCEGGGKGAWIAVYFRFFFLFNSVLFLCSDVISFSCVLYCSYMFSSVHIFFFCSHMFSSVVHTFSSVHTRSLLFTHVLFCSRILFCLPVMLHPSLVHALAAPPASETTVPGSALAETSLASASGSPAKGTPLARCGQVSFAWGGQSQQSRS